MGTSEVRGVFPFLGPRKSRWSFHVSRNTVNAPESVAVDKACRTVFRIALARLPGAGTSLQ